MYFYRVAYVPWRNSSRCFCRSGHTFKYHRCGSVCALANTSEARGGLILRLKREQMYLIIDQTQHKQVYISRRWNGKKKKVDLSSGTHPALTQTKSFFFFSCRHIFTVVSKMIWVYRNLTLFFSSFGCFGNCRRMGTTLTDLIKTYYTRFSFACVLWSLVEDFFCKVTSCGSVALRIECLAIKALGKTHYIVDVAITKYSISDCILHELLS